MATTTSTAPLGERLEACPSVHEPFQELDGALVRIRLPGGVLGTDGARAVAALVARVGGAAVEITNRANLQLRGIPSGSVTDVRDALVDAGLTHADARADERRNVLASPTAGVDPTEVLDTRSLVTTTAARLASPSAAGCSPKFGVLLDGGGTVHVRGRAHDLAIGAVRLRDNSVRCDARIAGPLPLEYAASDTWWSCRPDDVPAVVDAVVDACRPFGRARALLEELGRERAWHEITQRAGDVLVRTPGDEVLRRSRGRSAAPVGILPERRADRATVGAIARLGRIDAATLAALADVVDQASGGEERALRLSPWRGIAVTDVPRADADAVAARLDALGLVTDPDHSANVVVACAGSRGCASGVVDTLADAQLLIDALENTPRHARPSSVHVSGCEKGCASPGRTAWSLVGGPRPGEYTVFRDLDGDDGGGDAVGDDSATQVTRFGAEVDRQLDPGAAVALVASRGEHR